MGLVEVCALVDMMDMRELCSGWKVPDGVRTFMLSH